MRASPCRVGLALWVASVVACATSCAPGGLERVEHLDADGVLRRVELPTGSSAAQVEASLGRPNVIRRGPGATTYWLYTFDHVRHQYLLTFHGEHLAHVRYVPRPGEAR
ncbi:hypothetical protein [Nannocystis sp.]|uniref:hypothetical protein n=1 Tax=Nannocystis sp. TaxID=1962667 RepID=UPI002422C449|nr:hypothetical protein [Nannocystis sp.]MBK7823918.1 hypothetical protein [Nannocystis sp.]MBK9754929.1 hypothetical protein [Nannocystis sp.]